MSLPDGPTEDSTDRDGAFSYATEWHAFTIGAAVGLACVLGAPFPRLRRFVFRVIHFDDEACTGEDCTTSLSPALREARDESWYALGGVVLGAIAGAVILAELAVIVSYGIVTLA